MICEASAFDALGTMRKDFGTHKSVDRIVSLSTINKAPAEYIDPTELEKEFQGDQPDIKTKANQENKLDMIATNIGPTTYV